MWKLRNKYTGECRQEEIGKLTIQAVQTYVWLPEEMRDIWLDSGGSMDDLTELYEDDVSQIIHPIRQANLFWVLEPGVSDFRASLDYALQLADWRHDHQHLNDIDDFIRPVAELRLPVTVLDHLPVTVADEEAGVALPADAWENIFRDVSSRAGNETGLCSLVDSAVRVALRKAIRLRR